VVPELRPTTGWLALEHDWHRAQGRCGYQYGLVLDKRGLSPGEREDQARRQRSGYARNGPSPTRTLLGQAYKTVYAAAASPYPYAQSFYNKQRPTLEAGDPDGVATLYQYNAKGEVEYTAWDLNRNDVIDFGGPTGSPKRFGCDCQLWHLRAAGPAPTSGRRDNSGASLLINHGGNVGRWAQTWTTALAWMTQSQTVYSGAACGTVT